MKVLDYDGLEYYNDLIENKYAPKNSPVFTGTPTAPTPTAGDDSTKIATTEFVQDAIDAEETRADGAYLPLTGGSVTGNLTVSGTITGDVTGTASGNLPLSGGTLTGNVNFSGYQLLEFGSSSHADGTGGFIGKTGTGIRIASEAFGYTAAGGYIDLDGQSSDSTNAGRFIITARSDSSTAKALVGKADGTLTWNGKNVLTDATVGTILEAQTSADVSLSASTAKNITSLSIPKGTWVITGHARFENVTSGKAYGAMFGGTSGNYNSNNDSAIYVHSTSNIPIAIQSTRIIVQSANSTVYFVGYANAACKVLSGATFRAVRIK